MSVTNPAPQNVVIRTAIRFLEADELYSALQLCLRLAESGPLPRSNPSVSPEELARVADRTYLQRQAIEHLRLLDFSVAVLYVRALRILDRGTVAV